jgi:hypothetical protein
MVPPVRAFPLALLLLGALSSACEDLSEFRGTFDGSIVEGNFVRSCFPPNTTATIRFDPDKAVGDVSALPKGARNWVTTDDGTFDHTVLEPVAKLAEDQLSQFDFPGPQRLRNYLLLARPESGPLANRDATVVVSLLENKRIELRIIARPGDPTRACKVEVDAGAGDAGAVDAGTADAGAPTETKNYEYFGLFRLQSSS